MKKHILDLEINSWPFQNDVFSDTRLVFNETVILLLWRYVSALTQKLTFVQKLEHIIFWCVENDNTYPKKAALVGNYVHVLEKRAAETYYLLVEF